MGFILRVMQDVSMNRYPWGPSQTMLDLSTSSPRRPFASSEGFPLAYRGVRQVSLRGRRLCSRHSRSSIYFHGADESVDAVGFLAWCI